MKKIAILYQAIPAPSVDGIIKPMKKGGYADSGADLAFALKNDYSVIRPSKNAREGFDLDWVFPDTEQGIEEALDLGAEILWLNTVLYSSHPIKFFIDKGLEVVGQEPDMVDQFDNKFTTNQLLKQYEIPIPESILIHKDIMLLEPLEFSFPLVLKPIRGRGSQGVKLVEDLESLTSGLNQMFSTGLYGDSVYAESFLSEEEITITVMPSGNYMIDNTMKFMEHPWCLPVIKRFNHVDGIAPYSGKVPVVHNSRVLTPAEQSKDAIQKVIKHCAHAATILNIKAPIRIDCRSDKNGNYFLFDLNLKPNMTGNIRKDRTDQNSLSAIAAASLGWSYTDFIKNIITQKWSL